MSHCRLQPCCSTSATRRPSSKPFRSSRARRASSPIYSRRDSGPPASCSPRAPSRQSSTGMTDAERLPPERRRALDDASFRAQLAYLLDCSPFYRRKLAGVDADAGLDETARLPLTDKRELKMTATADNPIGDHLCVDA